MHFLDDEKEYRHFDVFVRDLNLFIEKNIDKIDTDQLMTYEFYEKNIYNKGLAELYIDDLNRGYHKILYGEKLFDFIAGNTLPKKYVKHINYHERQQTLKKPRRFLAKLINVPGVYMFVVRKRIVYVGMSNNLNNRIFNSALSKLPGIKSKVYARIYVCRTASDATILEAYLISKEKPSLNGAGKYDDEVTIKLSPEPKPDYEVPLTR